MMVLLIGIVTAPFFGGCATEPDIAGPAILPASEPPGAGRYYSAIPASDGSLWSESGEMLFVDRLARRVGDTVTVDIVENTSSKMAANTVADSESGLDVKVDGMTGARNINDNLSTNQLWKSEMTSEFSGSGSSDRSGRVTASIGARVTEVLPNGNIVISGRREMRVNLETQVITVSGIVRPHDITADNRIKSTYLADARIEYDGDGVLAEKQRPGWGLRIMNYLWPF